MKNPIVDDINWKEYDRAVEWCARHGTRGRPGMLPANLSERTLAEITKFNSEFRKRVREFARKCPIQVRRNTMLESGAHFEVRLYHDPSDGSLVRLSVFSESSNGELREIGYFQQAAERASILLRVNNHAEAYCVLTE